MTVDIKWIWDNCPGGTKLEIVGGAPIGTIAKTPDRLPLKGSAIDPTDPEKKITGDVEKTRVVDENTVLYARIPYTGFLLYTGEWWHFKDSNLEQYNITSHHFNDIEMVKS